MVTAERPKRTSDLPLFSTLPSQPSHQTKLEHKTNNTSAFIRIPISYTQWTGNRYTDKIMIPQPDAETLARNPQFALLWKDLTTNKMTRDGVSKTVALDKEIVKTREVLRTKQIELAKKEVLIDAVRAVAFGEAEGGLTCEVCIRFWFLDQKKQILILFVTVERNSTNCLCTAGRQTRSPRQRYCPSRGRGVHVQHRNR